MTRPSAEDSQNPFNDPVDSQSQGQSNVLADNTLVVGRDVSLTLGADSLVVLGNHISLYGSSSMRA